MWSAGAAAWCRSSRTPRTRARPALLYAPDDLAAGFDAAGGRFEAMYDTVVYRHFLAHGGPLPDVREALAQRIHDAGIDDALVDAMRTGSDRHGPTSVVGVMGGHAEPRGSPSVPAGRRARRRAHPGRPAGRHRRRPGRDGGGEPRRLPRWAGSRRAERGDRPARHRAGLQRPRPVHGSRSAGTGDVLTAGTDDLAAGGLAIPTWLYGHEPANLFAGGIAKYFSNAIREDTLLRLARGGVVFAPGWAGTVQEVFQAATKAFYLADGQSGPLVFLGTPVLDRPPCRYACCSDRCWPPPRTATCPASFV